MATLITKSPEPSSLSNLINQSGSKNSTEALPLEILYNLQYQHKWTELQLHQMSNNTTSSKITKPQNNNDSSNHNLTLLDSSPFVPSTLSVISNPNPNPNPTSKPSSTTQTPSQVIISGIPPRQIYIHPDHLSYLARTSRLPETLAPTREYVLPMAIGQKWSLRLLSGVFDSLPVREKISIGDGNFHRDAKRVLMGMVNRNGIGGGGDGTVVYYIMQEGEVKPRQN